MGKQLNEDALDIRTLKSRGVKQAEIARLLGVTRQKVSYWVNKDVTNYKKRKKKFSQFYVDKIVKLARNKTTSTMSCRKIARIINTSFSKRNIMQNGKPLNISFKTVSNYLKEVYGKPKKIRKVFYLNESQKKKRLEFCRKILEKGIDPKSIMFTDECKFDLGAYTRDWIRLDSESQKKLKDGDLDVYDLINRPTRKFEPSIMVAGGISYYGLSKIILVEGTMNNFAYGQPLIFYNEDIEDINRKNRIHLIIEQDGASCHRSKANTNLLDEQFGKDGWLQNPPNSPDLAFPIEDLWAIIKPRVKRRDPQTLEELKSFIVEEWNSVLEGLIRNLCNGFIDRVKKVIQLNGARLEPEHLKKNKKKEEIYKWENPEVLPRFRFVYNDNEVFKAKKKEIKILKNAKKRLKMAYSKEIKRKRDMRKKFRRSDLKYLSLGRALSIIDGPTRTKDERDKKIKEIEEKIALVTKMSLRDYLKYLNGKIIKNKDEDNEENSVSTIDEFEERLDKIGTFIKNKNIKYNLKIKF